MAAAFNALLSRYTGKEDILLGIPVADRARPELQAMIGFVIDTHVLRTDLSGDPSFCDLLGRVQKGAVEVYSHRAVPFEQVVEALRPDRCLGCSPLFQVMLNWRDRDAQLPFVGLQGLALEPLLAQSNTSKFDLTLFLTDTGAELWLEVEYSTDLFDTAGGKWGRASFHKRSQIRHQIQRRNETRPHSAPKWALWQDLGSCE